MTLTTSENSLSSQNIIPVILKNLPRESGLTKIEYEGPSIALYTNSPSYLLENSKIISTMVSNIRKRIVIRTDESIRKSKKECHRIIKKYLPSNVKLFDVLFDESLGEAVIYVDNLSLLSNSNNVSYFSDLTEKTGWRIKIRKTILGDLDIVRYINTVIENSYDYRIKFFKEIGEKIFRPRLSDITEASMFTLGGSAEIGRSSVLIVTNESKILLDCGININDFHQLNHFPRLDVTGFNIDDLDAVVLSHAHLDHTGFLPYLFKYGYLGPIYCSEATLPLMISLFKMYNKNYYQQDIHNVIKHTIPLSTGIVTDISPDIKLVLSNSGHILGSNSIHLHLGNGDHNLVYTGDLKFGKSNLLDTAYWNFPRVETLLIEGTHGMKEPQIRREESDIKLVESLNETLSDKAIVLVPVSVLGISQEILYTIKKYQESGQLKKSDIFVDPSIIQISSIYEMFPEYLSRELKGIMEEQNIKLFDSNNIKSISQKFRATKSGIILLPTSKLLDYTHVLKRICKEEKNKILFLSNQTIDSLENNFKSNTFITNDEVINIKCKVESIFGFSNHSNYNQLLAYISRLKPKLKRVVINHGERHKVQNLATSVNRVLNIPSQYLLVPESIKLL